MTLKTKSDFHTVEDEWLSSYCAGRLSAAKRFVLDCQADINPRLSRRLDTMDSIGGAFLESAEGESLSDNFMSGLLGRVEKLAVSTGKAASSQAPRRDSKIDGWVPGPLADFLEQAGQSLKWKNMGFGLSRLPLMQEGREKLYLLKARAGMKMPSHSHHGQEWALILQGGYHVDGTGYVRGDLHREDETCTHTPLIDDHGEACITLVASEGGLKFSNPVMSILKPIIGV